MLANRLCSAKKAVPAGMFCIIAGLLVVNLSAFLLHHVAGLARPSTAGDFLRGIAIGLGIGFEIAGIVIMLPLCEPPASSAAAHSSRTRERRHCL